MFKAQGYGGGAGARYRSVDIASRVEGATPHRLIEVLFEELQQSIDTSVAALRRGELGRRGEAQARALSILHALEVSLDFDRGGEIARGLAAIYREARRLIVAGLRDGDPNRVMQASQMLGEIAEAWRAIG